MIRIFSCFSFTQFYFFLTVLSSSCICSVTDEIVVAVYEHKPTGDPNTDTPLQLMRKNVEILKIAAKKAAFQNAELLVFPEYGVYSNAKFNSRDTLLPYLQKIPKRWTPCQSDISGSEIFLEFSCIAQTYNLTIVANIGTVSWCETSDDSVCPEDGRFQFNSNVVFDKNGKLQTVYHKFNLFGEKNFDKPKLQHAKFTTDFGSVGVVTCFDLLFKEPAIELVEKFDVRFVVLPSFWFNRIPFLALYEIAEAWAVRMKTFLLVANIHSPSLAFVGSGIFGPNGVVNYTYVTESESTGQLVLGRIPSSHITTANGPPSSHMTRINHTSSHMTSLSSELSSSSPANQLLGEEKFKTFTNGDEFSFVEIRPEFRKTLVCQGNFCCFLEYNLEKNESKNGFFALGAFSGLHRENYTLCNEICAVIRCLNKTLCGDGISDGALGFRHLHLQGNFSKNNFRFPTVLVDSAKLAPNGTWKFTEIDGLKLTRNQDFSTLVFAIYGRCFSGDPPLS